MPKATMVFNRAALREIDRRAVAEFHIPILVLMENAGRAVAQAAMARLKPGGKVLILAGPGNNGGDGLVAARHLHNAGVSILILLLAAREHYHDTAAAQLAIVDAMRLPVEIITPGHPELRDWIVESAPDDLMIDALFGTGLSRPVDGLAAEVIRAANGARRVMLAVDIPSGLDCDTGQGVGNGDVPVIQATETISFCGLKPGFISGNAFAGKVSVAEIGVPSELLKELALK